VSLTTNWSGSVFDDATELILELQFGEGGDDSKLFTEELLSAYLKYIESKKLKSELLSDSEGHFVVKIEGKNVWSAFKHEAGKHVVQRSTSGKPHTSYVSVGVLPLPPKSEFIPLPVAELDIKTQRGSGPGGQARNKLETAVRITHKPTGLKVMIQNGRDQSANKSEALRILTARVNEQRNAKQQASYGANRKEQVGNGSRGNKIRTYDHRKSQVTDHRTKKKAQIKQVMKGRFDLLLD